MTRLASWVLLALVAVLGTAGAASSAPAWSTPSGPAFTLEVDRHTVHTGQTLTATATAKVTCDWIVEWGGVRRHVRARTFTTTFTAPEVARRTRMPLTGTCVVAPARTGSARTAGRPDRQSVVVRIPPHASHTVPVTVVPGGGAVSPPETGDPGGPGGGAGGLPNTGGPSWWLLVAGLGALATGSVVVRRAQH